MSNQQKDIARFLSACGWDDADRKSFPADFSSRKYLRLRKPAGGHAVLMIADKTQKTNEFVAIAKLLCELDISAPEIFAADPENGLVLMEDFGDTNFGKMMDAGAEAFPLYQRGIGVLAHLHKAFDAGKHGDKINFLPTFNAELFAKQAELFLDGYFLYAKKREANNEDRKSFNEMWMKTLQGVEDMPQTLMLRDYMPDNLMSISGRKGWRDTGVLDFQDAGFGPLPYDIASLCENVRRDQNAGLLDDMINCYLQINPVMSAQDMKRACYVFSAQRHTRILGILAKRPEKRPLLPRVEGHMKSLLRHEALSCARDWFDKNDLL